METVETVNSTLQNLLAICEVVLCYVIPVLLVVITILTFTSIFGKWAEGVKSARDGFVKTAEAIMNGIASFFGLLAKKYARWVMLAITLVYIICVCVYLCYIYFI